MGGKLQGVCKLNCSALKLDGSHRLAVVQGNYLGGQLIVLREQVRTSEDKDPLVEEGE